jgi:hypothetical protein
VQPPHEPVRIIVQRTPLRAPSNKPSRNSTPWSIGTAKATRGRDRNAKQPEMDDVDGIERRKAKPLPALQYLLRFAPSSRFAWLLSFVYFPTPPPPPYGGGGLDSLHHHHPPQRVYARAPSLARPWRPPPFPPHPHPRPYPQTLGSTGASRPLDPRVPPHPHRSELAS